MPLTNLEKNKIHLNKQWKKESSLLKDAIADKRKELEIDASRIGFALADLRVMRSPATEKELEDWQNQQKQDAVELYELQCQLSRLDYKFRKPAKNNSRQSSKSFFDEKLSHVESAFAKYEEENPADQDYYVRFQLYQINKKINELFPNITASQHDDEVWQMRLVTLRCFIFSMLQQIDRVHAKENLAFAKLLENLLFDELQTQACTQSEMEIFAQQQAELAKSKTSVFVIDEDLFADAEKKCFADNLKNLKDYIAARKTDIDEQEKEAGNNIMLDALKNNYALADNLITSIEDDIDEKTQSAKKVDYKLHTTTLQRCEQAIAHPANKADRDHLLNLIPHVAGAASPSKKVIGAMLALTGGLLLSAILVSILATYGGAAVLAPFVLPAAYSIFTQVAIYTGIGVTGGASLVGGLGLFGSGGLQSVAQKIADCQDIKETNLTPRRALC